MLADEGAKEGNNRVVQDLGDRMIYEDTTDDSGTPGDYSFAEDHGIETDGDDDDSETPDSAISLAASTFALAMAAALTF